MALCTGEQTEWAVRLLDSLSDTTTPTGQVTSWLRNNLFQLNMRLGSEFALSGECIIPDMSQNVSGIYSEIYFCNWYQKQVSKNLGAAEYSWVSIRGEEQGEIRRANRGEVAKTYLQLSKACKENLDQLIGWFNGEQNTYSSQILYGQRAGGANFDLIAPPSCYYSDNNFIWNN